MNAKKVLATLATTVCAAGQYLNTWENILGGDTGSDISAILLAALASLGLGTLLVIRRRLAQ
jgi:LPXTG-motif cell wall-anchored protein